MDALGNVATRTGAALFQGENADLRSSFGHQMRDLLKSGVEGFVDDDDDIVVEAEDAQELYEDAVADAYRDAVDETAQAMDAAEDAAEEAKDAAEDAADKVEEAEDAAEAYQEKLKSIDEETDEP